MTLEAVTVLPFISHCQISGHVESPVGWIWLADQKLSATILEAESMHLKHGLCLNWIYS